MISFKLVLYIYRYVLKDRERYRQNYSILMISLRHSPYYQCCQYHKLSYFAATLIAGFAYFSLLNPKIMPIPNSLLGFEGSLASCWAPRAFMDSRQCLVIWETLYCIFLYSLYKSIIRSGPNINYTHIYIYI